MVSVVWMFCCVPVAASIVIDHHRFSLRVRATVLRVVSVQDNRTAKGAEDAEVHNDMLCLGPCPGGGGDSTF